MKNSRSVLLSVFLCVVAVFGLLMLLKPNIQSANAEEPKFRTMEQKPGDAPRVVPLADPMDDKDVTVVPVNKQLYRVEVKATAEGRAAYEKEWAAFCAEHPSARCSPAPADGKGNTGTIVMYWNVEEK